MIRVIRYDQRILTFAFDLVFTVSTTDVADINKKAFLIIIKWRRTSTFYFFVPIFSILMCFYMFLFKMYGIKFYFKFKLFN